jgi:methyl-accepting chemotaxis protein
MGLRPKFNIVLFVVFAAGLLSVQVVAQRFLLKRMGEEVAQNAGIAMEALSAMPDNSTNIADLARISRIKAAFETLDYKLVPVALAPHWSAPVPDLAARFSATSGARELSGEVGEGDRRRFYLARPVRNAENKLESVRLVTIGMQFYIDDAERGLYTLMGSLLSIFVVLFLTLNLLLDRMIVRPIVQVSRTADKISVGNLDLPELVPEANDEIGKLVVAFNRMRRSTEEAIRILIQ